MVLLASNPASPPHVSPSIYSPHPPGPVYVCLLPPSRMQVSETEGALTRTYFSDAHKKAAQKVRGVKAVGQRRIARRLIDPKRGGPTRISMARPAQL